MMITEIKNLDDVRTFIHLLFAEGVNVHPDDDFNDYVNAETGQATYDVPQADLRNRLMEDSFRICEEAWTDIYDEVQEIYLIETGLSKVIPLPSEVKADRYADNL